MRDPIQYPTGGTTTPLMTAEELIQLSIPDKRVELVRGVLVVAEPPGYRHGQVEVALALAIAAYAKAHALGDVVASAGSRMVWVVDPARTEARVYRADGSESVIGRDGALEGEDVLPGFTLPLSAIL